MPARHASQALPALPGKRPQPQQHTVSEWRHGARTVLASGVETPPREATAETALRSTEKGNGRPPERGAARRGTARQTSSRSPSPQHAHPSARAFCPAARGAFCSERPSRHATGQYSAHGDLWGPPAPHAAERTCPSPRHRSRSAEDLGLPAATRGRAFTGAASGAALTPTPLNPRF